MIPMQYTANVKLPFVGWTGADDFASMSEARQYVAQALRQARRSGGLYRPTTWTQYYIRQHVMRFDNSAFSQYA